MLKKEIDILSSRNLAEQFVFSSVDYDAVMEVIDLIFEMPPDKQQDCLVCLAGSVSVLVKNYYRESIPP